MPQALRALLLEPPINAFVYAAGLRGRLGFLADKSIRICSGPVDLTLCHRNGLVRVTNDEAATTVTAGPAALSALLLGRADADELFFQRRLTITGDTALGLELRNLLESLPVPRPVSVLQQLCRRPRA